MSGSEIINHPLRDEPGLKTKKSMIIPDHQGAHAKSQKGQWGSVTDTLGPALLVLMARCKTRRTFTSTRGHTGEYSSPAGHVRVKALGPGTAEDIVSAAVGIIQYWEGTPHRVLILVLFIQNIPRKKIYSLQEYFEPKYSSKEKPERAYTF